MLTIGFLSSWATTFSAIAASASEPKTNISFVRGFDATTCLLETPDIFAENTLAFKNFATAGASTYLTGITVKLCFPIPKSFDASIEDTIKFLPSLT